MRDEVAVAARAGVRDARLVAEVVAAVARLAVVHLRRISCRNKIAVRARPAARALAIIGGGGRPADPLISRAHGVRLAQTVARAGGRPGLVLLGVVEGARVPQLAGLVVQPVASVARAAVVVLRARRLRNERTVAARAGVRDARLDAEVVAAAARAAVVVLRARRLRDESAVAARASVAGARLVAEVVAVVAR